MHQHAASTRVAGGDLRQSTTSEGTPGLLPYIAGVSAARNTIDVVRAAPALEARAGTSELARVGASEGGPTAMFTLNIGPAYRARAAHERRRGRRAAVAVLRHLFVLEDEARSRYYPPPDGAGGLNAAYGDTVAPLDQVLTPAGVAWSPTSTRLFHYLSDKFGTVDISKVTKADPFSDPGVEKLLEGQRPGHVHGQEHGPAARHARAAMTSRSRWRRHAAREPPLLATPAISNAGSTPGRATRA